MSLEYFHPATASWFRQSFAAPTPAQADAWPAIRAGQHTLIAAPTGSGKTLAAFLAAIDALVCEGLEHGLKNECHVLYVSPLKALSNDIHKNLQQPLEGIREQLRAQNLPDIEIRALVRTGDTPQAERERMRREPPHILVTTPESLYILLTSDSGRRTLSTVKSVIVDEIHALAGNKRGAHLALSLERLSALTPQAPVRIGLSATQKPIEEVARFLTGGEACNIINTGHVRERRLHLELPRSPLAPVMANEVWAEIYDRLAELINAHRTTLVFANNRRQAERVARHLAERIGEEHVTSHHGSLARAHRLDAEQRLKRGELKALVATASLELGLDIGDVDLVCQLGSPRSIGTFLQRVGRSGHALGALPEGRLFPLSRDDLVECAALLDAVRRGELDALHVKEAPFDVLAQQIVGEVACREWNEAELFELYRRAWPYRNLSRADYTEVVRMLAEGYATRRGRRSAYLHRDAVNGKLRGRRGAKLVAVTNGGAIPDQFDYEVILSPAGLRVGSLNEDFAFESIPGDIFQLGNTSYRILKVETGRVLVEDAKGQPPNIPFWFGEAPARTLELSQAVSRLREKADGLLCASGAMDNREKSPCASHALPPSQRGVSGQPTHQAASTGGALPPLQRGAWGDFMAEGGVSEPKAKLERWLCAELQLDAVAAQQLAAYLAAARAALGTLPTQNQVVFERFFDEAGDQHFVIHSPFGACINRAWGLALRKRFCRKFNFELQAAALEDSIVLSLGPTHSFSLEEPARYLNSASALDVLQQAVLNAPMFGTRWRWVTSTALAVRRNRNGRRAPPAFQRADAQDLVAVVFPDQLACAENLTGAIEIPDHPLVKQTLHDCLHEVMDADGFLALLRRLESGELKVVARDLAAPSPLAQEILSARPYAFLDDAPAEERRTLAVQSRGISSLEDAGALAALDPDAIARVRAEVWPEARDADELHDALTILGFLTEEEGKRNPAWSGLFDELVTAKRATRFWQKVASPNPVVTPAKAGVQGFESTDTAAEVGAVVPTAMGLNRGGDRHSYKILWVAAERLHELLTIYPEAILDPVIEPVAEPDGEPLSQEDALRELLRSRLEASGQVTVAALTELFRLPENEIEPALLTLEAEGSIMRGRFTPTSLPPSPPFGGEGEGEGGNNSQRTSASPSILGKKKEVESEWCERRLLARIHQYTLKRLRNEIEPVTPADYLRFLFEWQGVAGERAEGSAALAAALEQLEGFSAPAAAWEADILRARVNDYAPYLLDQLCAGGAVAWLRLNRSHNADGERHAGPVRNTPIAFVSREALPHWRALAGSPDEGAFNLSHGARTVRDALRHHGALFFADLVQETGLLRTQLEAALAELATCGLATADSFAGLRALITPTAKRAPLARSFRYRLRRGAPPGVNEAGRWSLMPPRTVTGDAPADGDALTHLAVVLLRRYGVVFRKVLERENNLPPWRELLYIYRRLEARGEVRGGRFVDGFSGEQFALPEAVGALRETRRHEKTGELVSVSAADPLNLVGIVTPGARVPVQGENRVLYRDGVPVAVQVAEEVKFMQKVAPETEWALRNSLLRRMSVEQHP
ncbi:MAG TPA: DEAD/DEAH box helicase [Gammaproteobacteria bacterium]|nr:DEAD/DEAH box helicase [Gammaproteobacteria bacterium]